MQHKYSRDKLYITFIIIYNREEEVTKENWESLENEKQKKWEKVRNFFFV